MGVLIRVLFWPCSVLHTGRGLFFWYTVDMHGLIFLELKKFVESLGEGTWDKLRQAAGLGDKVFLPIQEYADADAIALITSASQLIGKSTNEVLELFGEFIAPDLIKMYQALIDPAWRTLDLLEHTEETIHKVVRLQNPGAKPPRLQVTRLSATEAILRYDSPRKMCALAKGIITGLAKYYQETVTTKDQKCMLRGDPACEINVFVK